MKRLFSRKRVAWVFTFLTVSLFGDIVSTEVHDVRVVEVVGGLAHPWGFAFLPDGAILITERPGRLRLWRDGELHTVQGSPDVVAAGQGGLLDVALHPGFRANRWIYLTHSTAYEGGVGTTVTRARLAAGQKALEDVETIYRMPAPGTGGQHFGSRLAFDDDGFLFVSVGDRGQDALAQDLGRAEGKLLRLHDDGSAPEDNPFADDSEALDEIWSYGHRNAQGLFFDSQAGILWQHEHGPQGGDTLNAIERGANYGWPVATYGVHYGSGTPIGDLPHERPDIANPFAYWVPTSIAPSGLTQYDRHVFPGWRGDLFLGALVQRHIRRLVIDDDGITREEVLLRDRVGRVRDVATGPDGMLYFLTDQNPGGLYRLEPAAVSWWFEIPAVNGWRPAGELQDRGDLGWAYDGYWPWILLPTVTEGWTWVASDWSNATEITAFVVRPNDTGRWVHLHAHARWYYDFLDEEWRPFPIE